jgi:hypothetical protein
MESPIDSQGDYVILISNLSDRKALRGYKPSTPTRQSLVLGFPYLLTVFDFEPLLLELK